MIANHLLYCVIQVTLDVMFNVMIILTQYYCPFHFSAECGSDFGFLSVTVSDTGCYFVTIYLETYFTNS